ncbi:MAG: hypothetical protein HY609_05625 [Deltaproteobacteria bacterium]|nr:hypothetical protein [Deltaproteobacteria bacterium]
MGAFYYKTSGLTSRELFFGSELSRTAQDAAAISPSQQTADSIIAKLAMEFAVNRLNRADNSCS